MVFGKRPIATAVINAEMPIFRMGTQFQERIYPARGLIPLIITVCDNMPWLVMGGLSKEVPRVPAGSSRCRFRPDRSLMPKTLSNGQKPHGAGIKRERPKDQNE